MASLNSSIEGPAINKAYKSIVDSPGPANPSAASLPTYGQWAIFSVQAPLVSAFQHAGSQESVLRVFRTGEGELADMADEFSEGKIQYGFVKVRDPNTTLFKNVLIAWCGEGVPERTKGYYSSYTAAIQKVFQAYHVQINARTDTDLIPENIVKKVQDSSGSKYSGGGSVPSAADAPRPPVASKPVFTPSSVGGGGNFNPLGSGRTRPVVAPSTSLDNDGWGDAAQPTRSQLEKVAPAYQRTTVDMPSLQSQRQEPSRFQQPATSSNGDSNVVRGGYQPIGKVDIAAIRREAKEKGEVKDERATALSGAYEPVGRVDIAAIRARAQGPGGSASPPTSMSPSATGTSQRSTDDSGAGRISSLPKPKPTGSFGGSNFSGTRAPMPSSFDSQPSVPAAQVGAAGRSFTSSAGKTPAQQWAEKRAQAGGAPTPTADTSRAIPIQTSGAGSAGAWQSGYTGKKWDSVQTTRTGASNVSSDRTGDEPTPASTAQDEDIAPASGGVSAMRDHFKNAPIPSAGGGPPPPMDLSSKPNTSTSRPAEETQCVPPPPQTVPRPDDESDEEPGDEPALRPASPIRIAQPVARTAEPNPIPKAEEEQAAPMMPVRSLEKVIPAESELPSEPRVEDHDTARATAEQTTAAVGGGKTAIAQYDYEKAEDNELELQEGEEITGIDMVDDDWWMGFNSKGEQGLFPSNYVELVEGSGGATSAQASSTVPVAAASTAAPAVDEAAGGRTATAQYDYEAAEENELTFPEGAKITDVEFPDEDWWLGEYNGQRGLFPANYVELDQ